MYVSNRNRSPRSSSHQHRSDIRAMKVSDNETRWAKIGEINAITFVGKETILFSNGCHLIFIDLSTSEELIYTANNGTVGDGVQCFTGHRTQNVFAFAEKRTNPAIFIKTYPNFENIFVLKGGTSRGYVSVAFSESSFLVTLGDLPEFNLTVWNWRTGEKIASKDGSILMREQILRCNLSSPVAVAQLGYASGKLHVWDVYLCGKKCVLTDHTVRISTKSDPFTAVLWTTEGGLFVLDSAGCVYTMLPDYHLDKVIDFSQPGPYPTSFAWYKFGIAVTGPNNEIRHYKKSGTWTMDWALVPPQPISKLLAKFEYLIVLTENYDIYQVLPTQNTFKKVKENESLFDDFCLIYPTGQYLLAICRNSTLNLYGVATGDLVSTLKIEGKATVLVENPRFPYAALGFDNGRVKLISAYSPQNLVKLTQFYLIKDPITSICFNECGTVFVAANLTIGCFFVIEGLPGGQMEIVATIEAHRQIAHQAVAVSQDCYRIFAIPVTSTRYIAGNILLRYCIIKNKGTDIKEYKFSTGNTLYVRIVPTCGISRDKIFYAIALESKMLHEIEIKRGEDVATVNRKIVTGHLMRDVHLKLGKRSALTWASDGFVIARGNEFVGNIGMGLPHHRMLGGVRKAFIDPCEKYLISLGRDKVLVCTDLMLNDVDSELLEDLELELDSASFELMFSRRTVGFEPKGDCEGKCYVEVQQMKKIEKEKMQCKAERTDILKQFKFIQREVQTLLTKNLEGPENEKLDLREFNLNTSLYEEKAQHYKKLRKATEIYLRNLIDAQNSISDYMMTNFYDRMEIPGTAIKAIFSKFEVNNYVLLPEDVNEAELLKWIREQRRIERHLNRANVFHPWEPVPEEQVLARAAARPTLLEKDEQFKGIDLDEPEVHDEAEDLETKIAFSGSDMQRFIEIDDAHYLQNELQTYFQTELHWIIAKKDCHKLKQHFNDKFDKVMLQKLRDMHDIKEKNDRLRHIVSEINYFSEDKIQVTVEDPRWEQTEKPQLITEVKDDEVAITPYISPSEQAIFDAKAAEAERIRLLLLADDFRERALMAMMNGVLEVRWEDELKKDVPLPKCMEEKDPENFTEDDLKTVRDYEEKVKFLNSERQRYKYLLTNEYGQLAKSVKDHIRKFNGKLSDLLVLKLLIDSALSQEKLKINRIRLFQFTRNVLTEKEREIMRKIADNERVVHDLQKLLNSLHESAAECRTFIESFQVKDKFLDRAYKKEIQDLSPVIQEQALKLLRKRPKINIRSINSAIMLNELAKYILSNNTPPATLNQDCFDFLKQLDNLDLYIGVPTVVDEHTYALICRHRRHRVEYEIKLKAAQCEVAEAEATIAAFNKRLANKRDEGNKLVADLAQIREDLLHLVLNNKMQIVLPKGLVEIPLTGSLEDFTDALLICRKDVEHINRIILDFGNRKIKALTQAMTFRRKILSMEWDHKRLKMLIQDLEEKIVDIRGVRLTKEIQFYLKMKDKEKAIPFETEVDMIKGSYENTIQDRKDKVKRMKKQMNAIQANDKRVQKKIRDLNVDVCEFNLIKDQELNQKERAVIDTRMKILLKRSKLVQQIQDNHHEILMLQTELELLRLKTFPTLKYKICN